MSVPKINYPKEQMHRIRYTKLTPQQIAEKLAGAASPQCVTAYSDALSGKSLRIVTDNGPSLSYDFKSKSKLSLAVDGGSAAHAGYGALSLQQLVLISHLVPGTQTGYHLIVDLERHLATVFEVWFSGYTDNREVQRQIYFGYLKTQGGEPPQARHALTNRLEGKAYHWRQDNGIETLELYPSVLYSNFIELTRLGGELSFCGPSDYVKIDDDLYVYSRVECEFSGTMTLYALDLNALKQVGVRLGFDAADALEYYMFSGTGMPLGQIASFEPFDDHGEKIVLGNRPQPAKKGERPVYRPLLTNPAMTHEEVETAVAKHSVAFGAPSPMAGNRLPSSSYLAGKALTVRYDDGGPVLEYRFDSGQQLHWRAAGTAEWREETYEAWEPAPGVVFFGHLLGGSPRHDGVAIVLDFENALSSCVQGWLGTPYMANEAARKTWFGIIEMPGLTAPQYRRHRFTDELVGRALTWNYSQGLTSMHVYTTPYSFSWIIFLPSDAGGLEWSGPAQYVKLRDDLYLFNWLEEACNGTLGILVINLRTMHDCGIGYHCGKNGLSMSAIGAQARNAGSFDIRRFYGPKQA
ncbi:MAG TPA: MoaF N-terminal domain-containing protein [Steroidobacteraceae bacterium]|nr:MoaF N-terminal domain-containing protein [Steroidobacteraceae bacterium]